MFSRRWNNQKPDSRNTRPTRPPRKRELIAQSSIEKQNMEALLAELDVQRKLLECPPTPTPSFDFYCPSVSTIPTDLEQGPTATFATTASHYKPRHFASHGYGPGASKNQEGHVPLASTEDISPSLRSSFNSVMMYAPSQNLSDYTDNDFEDFRSVGDESPEYDGDGESEDEYKLKIDPVHPQRRSISGQYPYYGQGQASGSKRSSGSRHRSSSHSPTLSVRSALL